MNLRYAIDVVANFLLIAGLILYGSRLFAEYHATGKWSKNITGLLSGLGMIVLAVALALTPRNATVLVKISETGAHNVFLGVSSILLLAAIASFGVITYWRPLRLWHQRRIERELKRELPNVP